MSTLQSLTMSNNKMAISATRLEVFLKKSPTITKLDLANIASKKESKGILGALSSGT